MPICTNCGTELNEGQKFCFECGAPASQVKKCPSCQSEIPLKMKFCPECGYNFDGAATVAGATLGMGGKNVIAGDVHQNISHTTINNVVDQTKSVNACAVCGAHMTNDNGHTCPKCGKVVCAKHFNEEFLCCAACASLIEHKSEFVVAADGSGDFINLQDAIAAARNRVKIVVKPGDYKGPVVVNKQIQIIGEADGFGYPTLWDDSVDAGVCLKVTAPAMIKNLQVTFRGNVDCNSLHYKQVYAAVAVESDAVLENVFAFKWYYDGFVVNGVHKPQIRNCKSFENGGSGICFSDSLAIVENCDIFENENSNVAILGKNPLIRNCKIHDGKGQGVRCLDGDGMIENCDIFRNEMDNVSIELLAEPVVRDCRIYDGKWSGIIINSSSAMIENCDIFKNECPNIVIEYKDSKPTIRNCKIHDGKSCGILVKSGANGIVESCQIFKNANLGVLIQDADTNPKVLNCDIIV